jgi:hypothetical protein
MANRTRSRIIRFVRNIAISVAVLLVIFIGGGAAYTWYMGRTTVVDTSVADSIDTTPTPVIKHVQPAANANESASVQMLTSPVAPGSNASVTVKTNPSSECTIAVEYNKVASKDSGLRLKTADEFGIVSWTWTVEVSVPLGTWPVKVTCINTANKKSAFVQGDLVVARP